jgi:hypothetical protein
MGKCETKYIFSRNKMHVTLKAKTKKQLRSPFGTTEKTREVLFLLLKFFHSSAHAVAEQMKYGRTLYPLLLLKEQVDFTLTGLPSHQVATGWFQQQGFTFSQF